MSTLLQHVSTPASTYLGYLSLDSLSLSLRQAQLEAIHLPRNFAGKTSKQIIRQIAGDEPPVGCPKCFQRV